MQNSGAEVLDAWTALLVAHRRLTTRLDAELQRGAGTTLDEYDVLLQLRRAGRPIPMTELAEHLLISRASTTRVVDRLVDRRWVARRHDEGDRRRVFVGLTDDGRRAQKSAGKMHLKSIAELVGTPLRGHDVKAVTAALQALAQG